MALAGGEPPHPAFMGGLPSMRQDKTTFEKRKPLRNRKSALKKAEKHFQPVLKEYFDEPAFTLAKEISLDSSKGALTAILFLSRFIDMFGDLVEREDYSIESFKRRNREDGFGIAESVFEDWKRADCLRSC